MTDLTDIRVFVVTSSRLDAQTLKVATGVFDSKIELLDRGTGDFSAVCASAREYRPDVVVVSLFNTLEVQELIRVLRNNLTDHPPYFVAVSDNSSQEQAIRNIGELEIDTLLFTPYTNEQMQVNLAAGYQYHRQYLKLQEQFKRASATAMTAMETASEIGFIMKLVDSLKYATTHEAIADQVFSVCGSLGLKAFMMMHDETDEYYFPRGQVTDSIQHVMANARASTVRLIEHKRLLLVRMDLMILMVTNAPWQDDARFGRVKDFLCQMGPVVESRIRTVMVNQLVEAQHTNLMDIMNMMRRLSVDTQNNTRDIMHKLSNDLEVAAVSLDLSEEQENHLLKLSNQALESLETLYMTNDALESYFHSVIDSLSKVRELTMQYTSMDTDDSNGGGSIDLF
ncbi:MAG: hypothetical protein R3208_07645 [Ketobacteraceae bacterium]|nr:hypothetical protein [Ketobacteraceae bacterium]